jgi:uncharacterized protein RhaS with RHS repeats
VGTSYTYDQYGNITNITNPRGGHTSFTYDTTNQLCLVSKIEGASPAIANPTRKLARSCDFGRLPS